MPVSDSTAMGHRHSGHGHDDHVDAVASPRALRVLWALVLASVALALVIVVATWPHDRPQAAEQLAVDPVGARIESVEVTDCSYGAGLKCQQASGVVTGGAGAGDDFTLELAVDAGSVRVAAGDDILVQRSDAGGTVTYLYYDHERGSSLTVLLVVFAVAVVVLGRIRGLGALAGLVVSVALIVGYVVPSLIDGHDAVVVSLAAATIIATLALVLAHGKGATTAVALVSSLAALAVTGALSYVFVRLTHLSGLSDENVQFLSALQTPIDARGLLLAGMVIGALGVLDDVTVTQVSAVAELRRLQPDESSARIYTQALRIGRDHISSTVNTLFLAYAGASLSLLLVFAQSGRSLSSVAVSDVVATEIVRALVGSIGLVSSVPIATGLAALVLRAPEPDSPRAGRRSRTNAGPEYHDEHGHESG